MYIFNSFIYSIHIIQVFSFVCVLTWSLLGVIKKLGPRLDRSPIKGFIQNFRRASPPLSHAESPPPGGLTLIVARGNFRLLPLVTALQLLVGLLRTEIFIDMLTV